MFIYMHASNKSFIGGSTHYLNDTIRFDVPSKGKDEEYHGISPNEEPLIVAFGRNVESYCIV